MVRFFLILLLLLNAALCGGNIHFRNYRSAAFEAFETITCFWILAATFN